MKKIKSEKRLEWYELREFVMLNYSLKTQRLIFTSLNYYFEYSKIDNYYILPLIGRNYFTVNIITKEVYLEIMNNLVFENEIVSLRNKMIIKVLWETGLRISELINLKWTDISQNYIKVTSKGNKTRYIPYVHNLFDELITESNKKTGYVFKTLKDEKISYSTIVKLFKKIGIFGISAHTFRHTFATRLLKAGVPLNYVSEMLGHSSLETTKIYIHFSSEEIYEEMKRKIWN